jgi:hypothetical protein
MVTSWALIASLPSLRTASAIPCSILFKLVALIAGVVPLTHVVLLYAGISNQLLFILEMTCLMVEKYLMEK